MALAWLPTPAASVRGDSIARPSYCLTVAEDVSANGQRCHQPRSRDRLRLHGGGQGWCMPHACFAPARVRRTRTGAGCSSRPKAQPSRRLSWEGSVSMTSYWWRFAAVVIAILPAIGIAAVAATYLVSSFTRDPQEAAIEHSFTAELTAAALLVVSCASAASTIWLAWRGRS